jgi:hypothetical protein
MSLQPRKLCEKHASAQSYPCISTFNISWYQICVNLTTDLYRQHPETSLHSNINNKRRKHPKGGSYVTGEQAMSMYMDQSNKT